MSDPDEPWPLELDYPRVLHLIPSLAVGGTERQLVQLINRSSRPEMHVVAVFYEPGSLASQIPKPVIRLGRAGRRVRDVPANVRIMWTLRNVLRRGVDLVHAHLGLSEILASLAAPRRLPIVASRRGRNVGVEERWWLRAVEGLGHRRVDVMICNSHHLAEHTRRHDLWPPRIEVVRNGIDLDAFQSAPMPPANPPTVVVVANMYPYKRHDEFMRAFRLVVDRLPSARAVLVGDGKERLRLRNLASALALTEHVDFVGEVPDARPCITAAHLVALTSAHEGFPNALLEAMAMGRPVIATRVGGIPELVRDGVDGFLTSRDPSELAERMLSLLLNAELRNRMGRDARRRAEGFGWDRVVRQTERVYLEVLERRMRGERAR